MERERHEGHFSLSSVVVFPSQRGCPCFWESVLFLCSTLSCNGILALCILGSECTNTPLGSLKEQLGWPSRVHEGPGGLWAQDLEARTKAQARPVSHPALMRAFQAEVLDPLRTLVHYPSPRFFLGSLAPGTLGIISNWVQLSGIDDPRLGPFPYLLICFFGLPLKSPYSSHSLFFFNHKSAQWFPPKSWTVGRWSRKSVQSLATPKNLFIFTWGWGGLSS